MGVLGRVSVPGKVLRARSYARTLKAAHEGGDVPRDELRPFLGRSLRLFRNGQ